MKNRKSFTLIELLMVVAIILILVSLLTPSFRQSRKLAARVVCGSSLNQIGTAITSFTMTHKGKIPPGANSGTSWSTNDSYWMWPDWLNDQLGLELNQAELDYAGNSFKAGTAGMSAEREKELRGRLKVLRCASDRSNNGSIGISYSPNAGDQTGWLYPSYNANGTMNYVPRGAFTDLSNAQNLSRVTMPAHTLMVGERSDNGFGPTHTAGGRFSFADQGAADNLGRSDYTPTKVAPFHRSGYLQWVQADGSMIYDHYLQLISRQKINQ